MNKKRLLDLYFLCSGIQMFHYSDKEQDEIAESMKLVISAKSAKEGSKVIEWWNCWDDRGSATDWARKARKLWKKMEKV